MNFNRPQTLRLRGAANNDKPDAGGRGQPEAFISGSIRCRRTYSQLARAFFAACLFLAPLGALAHDLPTSGDVGFLSAGASCPGPIEGLEE